MARKSLVWRTVEERIQRLKNPMAAIIDKTNSVKTSPT